MQGWISLHRELLDKPIWKNSNPSHKAILITLLLMANHKENEWYWQGEKFHVKAGQFVTSLENIAEKAGSEVSTSQVRRAIERFSNLHFLTNKSTKQGRLITIVNWELYQSGEKKRQTNEQSTDKRPTPNNNDNNETKEITGEDDDIARLYRLHG